MQRTTNVFATYANIAEADHAIRRLLDVGIPRDRISVMARAELLDAQEDDATETDVGRSAAAGAVGGAMAGVLTTLGLAAVPGVGWLLAAGPLATLLGATLTGTAAGSGIAAGLAALGLDEEHSASLQEALENGGVLVAVEPPPTIGGDAMTAMQLPVRPDPSEPLVAEEIEPMDPAGRDRHDTDYGRPTVAEIHG